MIWDNSAKSCFLRKKKPLFNASISHFLSKLSNFSAIRTMWSILLFPIIPIIFIFLKAFLIIFGIEIFIKLRKKSDPTSSFNEFFLNVYYACNFVACIWTLRFLGAVTEMTFGGAVATWYWTSNKMNVPSFTALKALSTTLKYHAGTAAFGSLVSIFMVFWNVISLVTSFGQIIGCGALSYQKGFTRCQRFLQECNRDAYIMCAIYGKGLYMSADKADQLIIRNMLRYITLDAVTFIVFGLIKFLLAAASLIVYNVVDEHTGMQVDVAFILIVYLISDEFLSVYSIAVDTLVLCFRK